MADILKPFQDTKYKEQHSLHGFELLCDWQHWVLCLFSRLLYIFSRPCQLERLVPQLMNRQWTLLERINHIGQCQVQVILVVNEWRYVSSVLGLFLFENIVIIVSSGGE